ncbi:MAG: hypothetical protein AB203_01695 [Parcubacteria bacterium C7867-008]|nr:MAG: hypothetical protein AB203_01695 [Parcubacteria bacterium C7867-008]
MKIRRVDTVFGILFVFIAACSGAYAIIHTLNSIPAEYLVASIDEQ